MRTSPVNLIRMLLAALALCFGFAPHAEAGFRLGRSRQTVTATQDSGAPPEANEPARAEPDKPRGDPVRGALVIAAAVAFLVFLAWIAVRIGDSSRPADKVIG